MGFGIPNTFTQNIVRRDQVMSQFEFRLTTLSSRSVAYAERPLCSVSGRSTWTIELAVSITLRSSGHQRPLAPAFQGKLSLRDASGARSRKRPVPSAAQSDEFLGPPQTGSSCATPSRADHVFGDEGRMQSAAQRKRLRNSGSLIDGLRTNELKPPTSHCTILA